MHRTILFIGRFLFLLVFVVFSIVFLSWEVVTYLKYRAVGRESNSVMYSMGDVRRVSVSNSLPDEFGVVEISGNAEIVDARSLIVKRYLEKYKSPLAPYSDLICQLSDTYGFEYYWIPAIAQQESNLCKKIPEGSYNCWGYGIHSRGTLRFENYDLALRSYAEYLKRVYFDKGFVFLLFEVFCVCFHK